MTKKTKGEGKRNPWDRCPWPNNGDSQLDTVYSAVGRALSEWERYESRLSFLFANFLCTGPFIRGAMRTYSSVRTFEGRTEMLRAASESYFDGYHPRANHLLDDFKAILRDGKCFSQRRNDIAHGVVDHFRPEPPEPEPIPSLESYALFPAYSTFKERDLEGTPTYCYTSNELEYFRQQFYELREPVRIMTE